MHVYRHEIVLMLWSGELISGLILVGLEGYELIGWILLFIGIFSFMISAVFHWLGWYD